MTEAKRRGVTCGITEPVAKKKTCSDSSKYCSAIQLCERAIFYDKGSKVWKEAGKHVAEAKRRGLTCGVTESVAKKKTCAEDVKVCGEPQLCWLARVYSNDSKSYSWETKNDYRKHVTEAKRRGLTCGVTEPVAKKKTCAEDAKVCSLKRLCENATWLKEGVKVWEADGKYVTEAKRRGEHCGVTNDGAAVTKALSVVRVFGTKVGLN